MLMGSFLYFFILFFLPSSLFKIDFYFLLINLMQKWMLRPRGCQNLFFLINHLLFRLFLFTVGSRSPGTIIIKLILGFISVNLTFFLILSFFFIIFFFLVFFRFIIVIFNVHFNFKFGIFLANRGSFRLFNFFRDWFGCFLSFL